MVFLWSDAWMLQAIGFAAKNGPATLGEVIEAADAVNHALPAADELHGGLLRLTEGGFVQEVQDRFSLTGKVEKRPRSAEPGRVSRPDRRQDSRRREVSTAIQAFAALAEP